MKEKRSKKERKKEKAKKESRSGTADSREDLKVDWETLINYYNAVLDYYHSPICRIVRISKGYKSRLQDIVNENNTKTILATAINKMAQSDFLNGRKKGVGLNKQFLASFTWLFGKDENFDRVVDGFYDNPPEYVPTEAERRQEEAEQREAERQRQREEVRRIEEEEREARRQQREYDHAHRASPEELEKIFAEFKLPSLKPDHGAK